MKKYIIGCLILMVVIVGGCRNDDRNQANNPKETSKAEITLEEAKEIALKEVNGGVVKANQDSDDGITYYEIDIVKDGIKYDFEIDLSGTIISKEIDDDYVDATNKNYISQAKAEEIALAKVGGGSVEKSKLEHDDGIAYYEIDIVKDNIRYDVEVSATDGNVIKYEIDD
ncbi:putative membrane protein YkoI [Breznakia sp. PF5-3]|uniref:PepSY domain-containing protein n=1 Tax=unclassified Breznakia TaxID=2623764 RepID=UPI00240525C2|nr:MULTISPECIES: PepSY domain-containing protein [unclassified Breznakia]MDF9824008.1 putative membrane protein YkoI [Breznakia sp. PM6-1]MDF9834807.1 putative membrane protein YkoI [Breznakia sp. PF5-3]MDF9838126.1 putative membrane protein YkoI [Breznakia sp. PFB2-8]MDF9860112.1 putative membrane protein YkoI [Breznakia sp. PH5-24]